MPTLSLAAKLAIAAPIAFLGLTSTAAIAVGLPDDDRNSVASTVSGAFESANSFTPAATGQGAQWSWTSSATKVIIQQLDYRASVHHVQLTCSDPVAVTDSSKFLSPLSGDLTTCVLGSGSTKVTVPILQDGTTVYARAMTDAAAAR